MFATRLDYAYAPHDFYRLVDDAIASPYGAGAGGCHGRRGGQWRRALGRHRAVPTTTTTTGYFVVRPTTTAETEPPRSIDRRVDPRVTFSHDATAYGIEAEVPGFAREQVSVEFADARTLRIAGSTATPVEKDAAETTETTAGPESPAQDADSSTPAEGAAERSRSRSPKRTSIEEVRDESEPDYVDIPASTSQAAPQSPVFTASRTVSPAPALTVAQTSQPDGVATTTSENQRRVPIYTKSFERSFELPKDIDRDAVSAELKDGVLRIRIGRVEEASTRRVISVL